VDPDCAFAPLVRVMSALGSSGPTVQGVVLAGLAVACGLRRQLALYLTPMAGRRLDGAVERLHPGLRDLIANTQAAVDSALLSHRV
jgi:hypothetical protein